jgi:hypothetical protein
MACDRAFLRYRPIHGPLQVCWVGFERVPDSSGLCVRNVIRSRLMIGRLLGAVGLVLLIWLTGELVELRIESSRVRVERQSERIAELVELCAELRTETRRLGAPEGMLPESRAAEGVRELETVVR